MYIRFRQNQLNKVTAKHIEQVATMTFASVYPHYVTKVEKKGRNKDELHEVIAWPTGYDKLAKGRKMEKILR